MSSNSRGVRTPLGKVRFLGSAHNGAGEAWLMHVTSLALIPLSLYFVYLVLDVLHMDYNGVRATLGRPIPTILMLAFILSGIVHMEVGMRSVIVDYIHGRGRGWALLANTCFSALLALACVYAALRISFT